MAGTINILFLASTPSSRSRLQVEDEAREVEAALRRTNYREQLSLVTRWEIRLDALQHVLLRHSPHIVHFSHHGVSEPGIVLVDADEKPRLVAGPALASLFDIFRDQIRLSTLR